VCVSDGQLDDAFAKSLALQQSNEGHRGTFQAVDDFLAVSELSCLGPRTVAIALLGCCRGFRPDGMVEVERIEPRSRYRLPKTEFPFALLTGVRQTKNTASTL
ncbi:MAG: hypothetical protein ACK4GC_05515, partial [Paracoccaceae bacterium]